MEKKFNVFEYEDYRKLLQDWIKIHASSVYGIKKIIAEKIDCQPSYLTLVLKGERSFSIDQVIGLCEFLELTSEESDYLILLAEKGKAASVKSKNFLTQKIKRIKEKNLNPRRQVAIDFEIAEAAQAIYYSDPIYAIVHMAITIPAFQNIEALAQKFQLSRVKVIQALEFLERYGLVAKRSGLYQPTKKEIFLDKNSIFFKMNHHLWRLKVIEEMKKPSDEGLHFSMVFTLSKQDHQVLKNQLLKTIQEMAGVIRDSKEEELVSICLDYFKL